MKRFKNILTYLPHSATHGATLAWCREVSIAAHVDHIDLLSCIEDFLPDFPEKPAQVDEIQAAADTLNTLAAEKLSGMTFQTQVETGNPLKAVVNALACGEYDLLIIIVETECDRLFAERLVRKSPVAVLVVPMGAVPSFDRILTATDFSDLASLCIDLSEAFASLAPATPSIELLNVVARPSTSRATATMPAEDFMTFIEETTLTKLQELIDAHAKQPQNWSIRVAEHVLPSLQIMQHAEAKNVSLIVTGSHGRSALSTSLLGGQTADLVRRCTRPLLVVKNKNQSLVFLRSLLGLD